MNRILLSALLGAASFACSQPKADEGPEAEPHGHAHAEEVALDSAQLAALDITAVKAERRAMEGSVRLTGRVTASPVSKAQVTSPLGAKVVAVLVDEGEHVRKGQPLVALSDMGFIRMQEEYVAASAQVAQAEAELARQRALLEGEATAQKLWERAEADHKVLKARKESLGHQLAALGVEPEALLSKGLVDRFTLRSPIDGRVNGIRIFLDGRVEPTTVLLEVIDLHHFHVHLNAYERDLPLLREGTAFPFEVLNLPDRRFEGEIFSIGRTFDADGRSIPVHAHVEKGSDQLIEGMSVAATVPTGAAEQLAVPDAAIHISGDKGYLFLVEERTDRGATFRRIEARPGPSLSGYTAIAPLEELPANAEFASGKVFYLWSMLENTEGHDH